ncbi:sigma-70 family RNA polymerase sigma factor [Actinomycetospora endophytica]|uniref:Sigma-70 family RNA polymerase sigma factor n=1 Tax=Actinomycetospora endophytica TaxID=2291215 RepID=A0ABS8PBP0_9PSEU|nr:sigma-70 family RNA polymerase sigma factor [Actinomycetospora endophytica]MCD2195677.1 sigma-70 family RNA polymerase sigma factor [Actinomycetospora endophytica]
MTHPRALDAATERFEANRPRLTGLAYRMLGELHEAQDAVQDAWLRWSRHDQEVLDPEAWLTRVVVNLCRTRLTTLRDGRTDYVGPWLPEPVPTGPGGVDLGPSDTATERETLSIGMLRLLERLSPAERAVFVLHEGFGYPHADVAGLLDLPEATVRQHLHRARERVGTGRRRFEADPERAAQLTAGFLRAAGGEDLAALEQLLADDAVALSDGGGVASAARRPVEGRTRVARFSAGLARGATAVTVGIEEVNGGVGVVVRDAERVIVVMAPEFDADTGELTLLSSVLNPAKIARWPAAT